MTAGKSMPCPGNELQPMFWTVVVLTATAPQQYFDRSISNTSFYFTLYIIHQSRKKPVKFPSIDTFVIYMIHTEHTEQSLRASNL